MEDSVCNYWRQVSPKISEVMKLSWTYALSVVVNSFLCYTAIMLNVLTIHGIRKTSSFPRTLRTLLMNLAVSDVGVGLFAQPFYTSFQYKLLEGSNPECIFYTAFHVTLILFCTASLCGTTAITLDRLLAIHLHLRYQELVTHKRVVIMVISTWTLSVFLSVMWLWFPLHLSNFITTILAIFFHFLTAMAYFKIYLAVRHHKTQIQSLQVQREAPQPGERANFAGLIKLVIGVFYVYIVLFICYSLTFIFFFIMALNHHGKPVRKIFSFSLSLMFLNSSLNPVIYCWKMRRIRHSIMNIPRQIHDWYRNHFGWYMRP